MTIQQVRKDLRSIRYYYSKQKDFETAARTVGMNEIAETAERYNTAVRKAPIRLYDVYVSLYIHNNTQLVLSFDWDCTAEYIRRLNKQHYIAIPHTGKPYKPRPKKKEEVITVKIAESSEETTPKIITTRSTRSLHKP